MLGKDNQLVQKNQNKNSTSRWDIPFIIPQLREAVERVPEEQRIGTVCHLNINTMLTIVNRVCRQNDLPEVGVHGLRRSFATLCHSLEIPEHYTMVWGGWSNIVTVHKIYVKVDQAAEKKYADRFKSAFQNGNGI